MSLSKPVSSIMSTKPVVANESNKFSQVVRLFREFPIHHLPVVDADSKLIGMISSNDLYKVFNTLCNREDKLTMSFDAIDGVIQMKDIMTHNPVSIASTDSIAQATRIFAEKKFLDIVLVKLISLLVNSQ